MKKILHVSKEKSHPYLAVKGDSLDGPKKKGKGVLAFLKDLIPTEKKWIS